MEVAIGFLLADLSIGPTPMARFLRNLFPLLPKRDFASVGNGRLATRLLTLDAVSTANIIGSNDYNSNAGNLSKLCFSVADSLPSRKDASSDARDSQKCCPGCLRRDYIAMAVSAARPAVVNISVTQGFNGFGQSLGSGTIIDPDGTILTCAPVVAVFDSGRYFSKGKVDVTLQDGRTLKGTVVKVDLHSDIAVVKIKSRTPLPVAKFGSSSKLRPGDWVITLGGPLSLPNIAANGIVSCVHHKSNNLGAGGMQREYLQTSCLIIKGNLGGPVVNLDGEVVGVNNKKIMLAAGSSFALPIDIVAKIVEQFRKNKIVEQFRKNGRVVQPSLGLIAGDLNDMIIAQLKESDRTFPNVSTGILVTKLTKSFQGLQLIVPGSTPMMLLLNLRGSVLKAWRSLK